MERGWDLRTGPSGLKAGVYSSSPRGPAVVKLRLLLVTSFSASTLISRTQGFYLVAHLPSLSRMRDRS